MLGVMEDAISGPCSRLQSEESLLAFGLALPLLGGAIQRNRIVVTSNKRSSGVEDQKRISPKKRSTSERGPLPEVKEGNSQADWDLWSDSVSEYDSQFSPLRGDDELRDFFTRIKKTPT